jgi:galactokinase
MNAAQLARRFRERFGTDPRIFAAPGRVNLIGEHTDYNDGFVMPCAIGFHTRVAIAPRSDRMLALHSENFPQQIEASLDHLPRARAGAWPDYLIGVLWELRKSGPLTRGANVLVSGDVPLGAGLSSSASIEVACALAFMELNGIEMSLPQVAQLCQSAENAFVGAKCGIMDQFVSCMGKSGHALFLDCRSLEFEFVQVPRDLRIVICNTMVKHSVATGEYNQRRAECEEGVRLLSRTLPSIRALRDVTLAQLQTSAGELPGLVYPRCEHVIRENARVLEGRLALALGDVPRFGALMRESHQSLRDLFKVSCPELDLMVSLAEGLPGYLGARMTGGGFGGCTVNLVKAEAAEIFAERIAGAYHAKTRVHPDVFICSAASGARAESLEVAC